MHRSGLSRIEKEKTRSNQSNHHFTIRAVTEIPGETKIETRKTNCVNSRDLTHSVNNVGQGMAHTRPLMPDVLFHPGPTYRPPPKLITSNVPKSQESSPSSHSAENTSSDINLDFKESYPFQEGVISETYQRLDKLFFQEP